MNIEALARSMTDGRPRAGFTARVMAPIHGRPQPGFTAGVMRRIAAEAAHDRQRPLRERRATRAALVLFPAAIAIAAGTLALWAWRQALPPVPATAHVPLVHRGGADQALPAGQLLVRPAGQSARVQSARVRRRPAMVPDAAADTAQPPDIQRIVALDGPSGITVTPIELAPASVRALDGPAALKVSELPAAPSGRQENSPKEKP